MSQDKPFHKIAIVLVNYRGMDDTVECLQSIEENEIDAPFIIVVDNSQPNQRELESLKSQYSSIKIINNERNYGFGRGNNIGIEWAQENIEFDYLLLLNNDTLISHNALSKLTIPFQNHAELGISTCRIMYNHDRSIVWYGGGEINYKKGWPVIADIFQKVSDEGAGKSRVVSFASGCLMMFSKTSLEKIKGFDPDLFMYIEDMELSIRVQKLGLTIWYEAENEIYHKVQGSFKNDTKFKGLHHKNKDVGFHFYHKRKNQWITFRKHLKGKKFLLFCLNFWWVFARRSLKLIILSPKRWGVMKACFKVVGFIIFTKK